MSYTVRFAKKEDIPALMSLLRQVNKVHHDGRPDLFELTTKYTEEELAEILNQEQTPVFVCEDAQGRILGHGFCVIQQPENTRLLRDHRTLYIDDICVDEAARGKQVGKALYEYILGYAREIGCYNVTLNVWTCNSGAVKFYEKLGLLPYKIGMEKIL